MSGLAALVQLDGAPADTALLASMTRSQRHRGPDADGLWTNGGAGLGLAVLRTTPEAAAEAGPLHDAEAGVCLAFDGRVDNRDELRRELGGAGPLGDSDPALVLAAWRRWGEDMPRRIEGDFALALWDARRRILYCARDIIGLRPLHYARAAGRFLVASELRALLEHPGVPTTLDEGMFGEYLAFAITSAEDTLYAAIKRLPPAHWMRLEAGGRLHLQRYWDVDFTRRIRHRREEDYAQELRGLLEDSVRRRLRAAGPVGLDLSGGLDSSTVCAIADRVGDPGGLRAFTVAYPGLSCDETRFSDEVARGLRMPRQVLENREPGLEAFVRAAADGRDWPGYPVPAAFFGTLAPEAVQSGCRVFLSGSGGDECFAGEGEQLADLLAQLSLGRLWREAGDMGAWFEITRGRALRELALKPWLRSLTGRQPLAALRPQSLDWLRPEWVARIGLRERLSQAAPFPAGGSQAQRAKRAWTMNAHIQHEREVGERSASGAGIEYRHPLLDRRLVEFAFAVPAELNLSGGTGKRLLRRAMADLLPAVVLQRSEKADFSEVTCRAVERSLAISPATEWPVVRAGWVQGEALMRDFRQAAADLRAGRRFSGSAIWRGWIALVAGLLINARTGLAPGSQE